MNTRLSFEFVIGGKVRRSVSKTWGSPVTRVKRYTQWICKAAERQLFLGPEDLELRTDLCPISHRSRIHEPPSIPFLQVQTKKKENYFRHIRIPSECHQRIGGYGLPRPRSRNFQYSYNYSVLVGRRLPRPRLRPSTKRTSDCPEK